MFDEVMFNDVVISDFFQVIDVQRPIAGRSNITTSVSGLDGLVHTGSSMNPVSIGVSVIIPNMSIAERREKIRELSMMLHTDSQKPLMFASDNGLYYMAVLDGDIPVTEHVRTDSVTFNFVAESPVMYGEEQSVTVPSIGLVEFEVSGTYMVRPKMSGTVAGNSGNIYGLRLDNHDFIRVDLLSEGEKELEIDCDKRVVTVQGEVAMIELQSDWFELSPGSHVISNDAGTGDCTITWVERWL